MDGEFLYHIFVGSVCIAGLTIHSFIYSALVNEWHSPEMILMSLINIILTPPTAFRRRLQGRNSDERDPISDQEWTLDHPHGHIGYHFSLSLLHRGLHGFPG